MPVVGTAGHVDHGKSTLIQALTGRDPDRLAEEKRRGMTIDLGFGWMTLHGGTELSFVDVPGHESLVKNMLAGITGIQIALLVVAADEGWKAQTEEHTAILTLLDIAHGVVAVTKIDRVDRPRAEKVQHGVAENLRGTPLEGCPVVPVSAVTRQGLGDLVDALAGLPGTLTVSDVGRPRLWVDRSFTLPGAGTVVTGTLTGGSLEVGNRVQVWPQGADVRVRSIQTHQRSVDRAGPGRRVALALAGTNPNMVSRGSMLSATGQWEPTSRILVELAVARHVDRIHEKGAYQFHCGTAVVTGSHQPVAKSTSILRLERSLPLQVGDRLIIRDVGRRQVVGAATVLDPDPAQGSTLRQSLPHLKQIIDTEPNHRASQLLQIRGRDQVARLRAHSGGGSPTEAVQADGEALSPARADELIQTALRLVARHHTNHPLEPGIRKATLASSLGTSASMFAALLTREPSLVSEDDTVRDASHTTRLDPAQHKAWEAASRRLEDAGLQPPTIHSLGLPEAVIQHLCRTRQLVRINHEYALRPAQVSRLADIFDQLPPQFTVADFRNAAAITRKHAIPYLEWADTQGHTRRIGDLRTKTRSGGGRESNPPGANTTPLRF